MSIGLWDSSLWDSGDVWHRAGEPITPPSAPGWAGAWTVWAQLRAEVIADLTPLVVEAAWSTDGYTMGDGCFRGNLQPGRLNLRCFDPSGSLAGLDRMATIWLNYAPTGATWCYYFNAVTRPLAVPGDPSPVVVLTADTWPPRLLNNAFANTERPAERADTRLGYLFSVTASDTGLSLPPITYRVAAAGQYVDPIVWVKAPGNMGNMVEGHLPQIRKDGANGITWVRPYRVADGSGGVEWVWDRWETHNSRTLDPGQILAGPPINQAAGWVISWWQWAGRDAFGDVDTDHWHLSSWGSYGAQGPGAARVWAALQYPDSVESQSVFTTGENVVTGREWSSESYLSDVTVKSGTRYGPDGRPSAGPWLPEAHLFTPVDVAEIQHDGAVHSYRVGRSDHRLTARTWETKHTLEKYIAGQALP